MIFTYMGMGPANPRDVQGSMVFHQKFIQQRMRLADEQDVRLYL